MNKVAVIGAGAWGTALAIQSVRAGNPTSLWARNPGTIGTENPRLPGIAMPPALLVTADLRSRADALLVAVPLQHLRATLLTLQPQAPMLLCCKGMETGTGALALEIAGQTCPACPAAILTGPNFAREIALGLPAASVIAGSDPAIRRLFRELLGTASFRLYGNDDPIGAQLGGAAKNVIAIAAGAVIGGGFGENARAALVTRGLAEIGRLVDAFGGKAATVAGLSGLGDLLLTCTGPASRNFSYGLQLGQGVKLVLSDQAPVVEGVATAAALIARAALLDLPLCHAVAGLVAGRFGVHEALATLMGRRLRDE